MKRDLQTIIKESAVRYGLEYNPEQSQTTVEQADGSIKVISREDFEKAFKE